MKRGCQALLLVGMAAPGCGTGGAEPVGEVVPTRSRTRVGAWSGRSDCYAGCAVALTGVVWFGREP